MNFVRTVTSEEIRNLDFDKSYAWVEVAPTATPNEVALAISGAINDLVGRFDRLDSISICDEDGLGAYEWITRPGVLGIRLRALGKMTPEAHDRQRAECAANLAAAEAR
jgi:hypothetical protein